MEEERKVVIGNMDLLRDILLKSDGRIFRVSFIKRTTGELRKLVGRVKVHKNLTGKGMSYNPKDYNLLTVFDFQKGEYRSVNLEGLVEVVSQDTIYKIG